MRAGSAAHGYPSRDIPLPENCGRAMSSKIALLDPERDGLPGRRVFFTDGSVSAFISVVWNGFCLRSVRTDPLPRVVECRDSTLVMIGRGDAICFMQGSLGDPHVQYRVEC